MLDELKDMLKVYRAVIAFIATVEMFMWLWLLYSLPNMLGFLLILGGVNMVFVSLTVGSANIYWRIKRLEGK